MAGRYEREPPPRTRTVSERVFIPKWVVTVIPLIATTFGLAAGIVSTTWKVQAIFDQQTTAITAQATATASLRQTLDQTVTPALAEVAASTVKIAGHSTRLAVIERACCGESVRSTSTAGGPQ